MLRLVLLAALAAAAAAAESTCGEGGACEAGGAFYALEAAAADGGRVSFERFRGEVVLVVNVATECGYTEEGYTSMAALARKYGPHGLRVVAAPCNQFGEQEPGEDEDVLAFVRETHDPDSRFVVLSKLRVNGKGAHPLYSLLKAAQPGDADAAGAVQWNFERFVVSRDGVPVGRFASHDPWADTERLVRRALVAKDF